jgi:hypothetical protein
MTTTPRLWPEKQKALELHQELFEEATRFTFYLGTYKQWFGSKKSVALWNLLVPQAACLIQNMFHEFLTLKLCALLEPSGTGRRKNRNFQRLLELVPENLAVHDLEVSEREQQDLERLCEQETPRQHLSHPLEGARQHYENLKLLRDKTIAHRSECVYGPDEKLNVSVCLGDWAKPLEALEDFLNALGLFMGVGSYTVWAREPELEGKGGGVLRCLRLAKDYQNLVEEERITKVRYMIVAQGKEDPATTLLLAQEHTAKSGAITWS